nr:MAG TPA: hypothetical protein [Caudoviricetes sp.]
MLFNSTPHRRLWRLSTESWYVKNQQLLLADIITIHHAAGKVKLN